MVDYLARPPIHEAFFKKYASKKFLKGIYQQLFRRHSHLIANNARCSFHPIPPVGQEERTSLWY